MNLINGIQIAKNIEDALEEEIKHLPGRRPGLAFLRIGEDPASKVYIQIKKKKCEKRKRSTIFFCTFFKRWAPWI